ncbi:MAG TPA: YajQ family cyclic di-GMP-binding protein [Candidatus Dormibacteraeota bacterium]|nr:YajQ family cyclic di-GMP-binding protein [Candidatus Dormibacteraeota bacterium]
MTNFSFDIVSQYDKAEMNNVFDQLGREIDNRYDFKNTPAECQWLDSDKRGFKIIGNSEWQIEAILDIVRKKLAARDQSQKVLDVSQPIMENNLRASKDVPFREGLDQAKAKSISALLRQHFPKVKAQVQADRLRVTSPSKDDLQAIMRLLGKQDFDFPLSFINYR